MSDQSHTGFEWREVPRFCEFGMIPFDPADPNAPLAQNVNCLQPVQFIGVRERVEVGLCAQHHTELCAAREDEVGD